MLYLHWPIEFIQDHRHHIYSARHVSTLQIHGRHPLDFLQLISGKHFLRPAEFQSLLGLYLDKYQYIFTPAYQIYFPKPGRIVTQNHLVTLRRQILGRNLLPLPPNFANT